MSKRAARQVVPTEGPPNASEPPPADVLLLARLAQALLQARAVADERPPLVVLAPLFQPAEHRTAEPSSSAAALSLRTARDDWLRRLQTSCRSESSYVGYRVAIDDLLAWAAEHGRDVFEEQAIVDHLADYRAARAPAPATYYRRFLLLRRFLRWVARRAGVPDPFAELEAPPKPRQERDWLTREEFARLLAAAARPERNLPGLAERDVLALRLLVTTGLRRSELCALTWRDVDLDNRPTLLVRQGKGGKPRRQPLPPALAAELRALRADRGASAGDPVVCGLAGGRLQPAILAEIVRRAARRAGLEKRVTAHTLRHTAATWLRQELGDAASSRVPQGTQTSRPSRYAHVEREGSSGGGSAPSSSPASARPWRHRVTGSPQRAGDPAEPTSVRRT
ncbi:MAG: tyrosine-type recombinase/integrase [Thermoleophilia bacterium]